MTKVIKTETKNISKKWNSVKVFKPFIEWDWFEILIDGKNNFLVWLENSSDKKLENNSNKTIKENKI